MRSYRNSSYTFDMKSIPTDDISSSDDDSDTVDDEFVIMVNETEKRKHMNKYRSRGSFDSTSSTNSNHIGTVNDYEAATRLNAKAVAAGVTTGTVGLVVGGPIVAAIFGIGTTFLARNDTVSPVGDAARSVGELAMKGGDLVMDIDTKHQISQITSDKVKEIDTKFHVTEKGTELVQKTKQVIEKMNHDHRFTEKVHSIGNQMTSIGNVTNKKVKHFNEKHGITSKLHSIWNEFEKNILLSEDDAEFQKQIQYLYMERQLEKEEAELLQQYETLYSPTTKNIIVCN